VRDAFPAEENVFVGDVSGSIGFVENLRARAEPVDFAVGFLDAVAIAIVGIVDAATGFDFTLGIPDVGIGAASSMSPKARPFPEAKSEGWATRKIVAFLV
jgi:hypothetical protein